MDRNCEFGGCFAFVVRKLSVGRTGECGAKRRSLNGIVRGDKFSHRGVVLLIQQDNQSYFTAGNFATSCEIYFVGAHQVQMRSVTGW